LEMGNGEITIIRDYKAVDCVGEEDFFRYMEVERVARDIARHPTVGRYTCPVMPNGIFKLPPRTSDAYVKTENYKLVRYYPIRALLELHEKYPQHESYDYQVKQEKLDSDADDRRKGEEILSGAVTLKLGDKAPRCMPPFWLAPDGRVFNIEPVGGVVHISDNLVRYGEYMHWCNGTFNWEDIIPLPSPYLTTTQIDLENVVESTEEGIAVETPTPEPAGHDDIAQTTGDEQQPEPLQEEVAASTGLVVPEDEEWDDNTNAFVRQGRQRRKGKKGKGKGKGVRAVPGERTYTPPLPYTSSWTPDMGDRSQLERIKRAIEPEDHGHCS
jgi:hypothetical protein